MKKGITFYINNIKDFYYLNLFKKYLKNENIGVSSFFRFVIKNKVIIEQLKEVENIVENYIGRKSWLTKNELWTMSINYTLKRELIIISANPQKDMRGTRLLFASDDWSLSKDEIMKSVLNSLIMIDENYKDVLSLYISLQRGENEK